MLDLLIYVFAGCLLGIFTGLSPGIHINTVSAIALAFAAFGDLNLALLIVAMSVVHSFVDFVPSILLGAPDSETFVATLPGHRMLMKGEGLRAIKLSAMGCLFGGILALISVPVFFLFINDSIEFIKFAIPWILILVLVSMIFSENDFRSKMNAFFIVVLSAALGVLTLRGNFAFGNILLPLATGFFGSAVLFQSIMQNHKFVSQKTGSFKFRKMQVIKGSFLGFIAGSLVSLIPSVGPAQAAFVVRKIVGEIGTKTYLVLIGSISTANMILSFFVLYATGNARSGSAAALKSLLLMQQEHLFFIAGAVLIALGVGFFASIFIAKEALKVMRRINYRKINIAVFALVSLIVLFLSGFYGILVYATATSIGIYAQLRGVKRINCMAFLIVPTVLIYFGI